MGEQRRCDVSAAEILSEMDLDIGTCSASYVRRACRLANDEGTIQAGDMLSLTNDPREHTTSNLRIVLLRAGCVDLSAK
jgi:hypothetical protein